MRLLKGTSSTPGQECRNSGGGTGMPGSDNGLLKNKSTESMKSKSSTNSQSNAPNDLYFNDLNLFISPMRIKAMSGTYCNPNPHPNPNHNPNPNPNPIHRVMIVGRKRFPEAQNRGGLGGGAAPQPADERKISGKVCSVSVIACSARIYNQPSSPHNQSFLASECIL
jgi:hypothetical protein